MKAEEILFATPESRINMRIMMSVKTKSKQLDHKIEQAHERWLDDLDKTAAKVAPCFWMIRPFKKMADAFLALTKSLTEASRALARLDHLTTASFPSGGFSSPTCCAGSAYMNQQEKIINKKLNTPLR